MQDLNVTPTCLTCQMTDPPPSMTCRLDRDHRVGRASGCPACGRLTAACARRPCSPMRRTPWPAGIAKARLRLMTPSAGPWRGTGQENR
jgi:hypothetical protein